MASTHLNAIPLESRREKPIRLGPCTFNYKLDLRVRPSLADSTEHRFARGESYKTLTGGQGWSTLELLVKQSSSFVSKRIVVS